jgi:hypothetical protein
VKDLCHCGNQKDSRSKQCRECFEARPKEKTCTKCSQVKPLGDFYVGHSFCKVCKRSAYREWYGSTESDRTALRRRARKLELDPDQILKHFNDHHGSCDLCGRPPGEAVKGRKYLTIDHDHQTGAFRGLLCGSCNFALGMFRDDADLMRRAADYVSR